MTGQFSGMLNCKAMYGQSYSDVQCLRSMKMGRLIERAPINWLSCKWNKRAKYLYPSWSDSLYNYPGDTIMFTQRQRNAMFRKVGRKVKVNLFPWRKV